MLGRNDSGAGTLAEIDGVNNSKSSHENSMPREVEFCTAPNLFYMDDVFSIIPDWAEAILTAGNILVIIFAFCGNIAALFVLWKSKTSNRSTRMFLVSLCASDLILVAFSPPFELGIILDIYHSWVYGSFLCKLVPFVQSTAVMVNAFCLLAIAMERYLLVVVGAFRVSAMNIAWQSRMPNLLLICIWLISIGITLPNYWSYELISFWTFIEVDGAYIRPRNETCRNYYFCNRKETFDKFNVVFYITIGVIFFSVMVGFLFCYLSIICFVKSHEPTRKLEGNNNEAAQNMKSTNLRHRRTTYLVMGILLLFTICRAPIFIYLVVVNIRKIPVSILTRCFQYSLRLLSNVNCVIQPFMYAIWNDSLRTGNNNSSTNASSRAIESGRNRDDSLCIVRICYCFKFCSCTGFGKCCHCKHRATFDPHIIETTTPSCQSTQKQYLTSKNELSNPSTLQSSSNIVAST